MSFPMFYNTRGNLQAGGGLRTSFSVNLGKTRNTIGSITRKFNYCNRDALPLKQTFECVFDVRKTDTETTPEPEPEPKPTPENPCKLLPTTTTYQVCSPWPQFGGLDNTNSRYSPILASQKGNLNLLRTSIEFLSVATSPVVAADGTIYIGYNVVDPNNLNVNVQGVLFAFYSTGTIKWFSQLNLNDTFNGSTPVIAPNGYIYFGSEKGYIYEFNTTGTLIWSQQYTITPTIPSGETLETIFYSIKTPIVIGSNNNMYFAVNCTYTYKKNTAPFTVTSAAITKLFSVNYTTQLTNWTYNPYSTNYTYRPSINYSVAIDSNNNIYFGYQLNNVYQLSYLVSVTQDGVFSWGYNCNNGKPQSVLLLGCPVLNVDNSCVYLLTTYYQSSSELYLNAVNTTTGTQNVTNSLTIPLVSVRNLLNSIARTNNDVLYFSVTSSYPSLTNSYQSTLYSVQNGVVLWQYNILPQSTDEIIEINNTPAIGSDGTIYFGITSANSLTDVTVSYVYALKPNGSLKWSKPIPQNVQYSYTAIYTSPVINLDGNIIISTQITNQADTSTKSSLYLFN